MYMIEEMGMEKFRQTVVDYVKGLDAAFEPAPAAPAPKEAYSRRDIVGVHPQKQEGKSWVCVTTPAGRLMAQDVSGWAGGPARPGPATKFGFCDPFFVERRRATIRRSCFYFAFLVFWCFARFWSRVGVQACVSVRPRADITPPNMNLLYRV